MTKKPKTGFTLIELAISVAIIAVLATIGFMVFPPMMQKSRDSRRKKELRSFVDALQMYISERGEYPPAGVPSWGGYIQGPNACGGGPHSAVYNELEYYLDTIPSDPQAEQGKEYYYHKISETEYCLVSELENTDDLEYESGDRAAIMAEYDGCDIQSVTCGTMMQTPHYVVSNP